jgi:hypothetical protein
MLLDGAVVGQEGGNSLERGGHGGPPLHVFALGIAIVRHSPMIQLRLRALDILIRLLYVTECLRSYGL